MSQPGIGASPAFPRLLALVTFVGVALRLYGLGSQPPTTDDQMVLISAVNYVDTGQLGPTMWNHPVLRNILAYGMLKLFGSGQFGTLGLNLLLGSLCIPLVYAVARRLTSSTDAALLAALIWALEPLAVDYSRQAINDVYLAFFPLVGILAVYRYLESDRPTWLLAAGTAFGCGLASKWSALFQLMIMAGYLLYRFLRSGRKGEGALAVRTIFLLSALIILPVSIYLATFAPWFGRGYSLAEWPALQQAMYRETKLHTGYKQQIYGDHQAWQWFLVPGISHEDYIFSLPASSPRTEPSLRENLTVLQGIANPLVWLATIPALILVALRAQRQRSDGLTLLAVLLLGSYVPMAMAFRPIWFNTGMVVLPYVAMVVAYAVVSLIPADRERLRRVVVPGYIAALCLVSLLLYPLAIGKGSRLPVVGDYLFKKAISREGVSREIYEQR